VIDLLVQAYKIVNGVYVPALIESLWV